MNPFSAALLDYHNGDESAAFVMLRDDGFRQRVPVSVFFSKEDFPPLEAHALELCQGHVLDIGAAAGRHSIHLIQKGFQVTSLDILPETEIILRKRGVTRIITSDILTFSGERFDTLLMLMNGIGMVGTLDGLDRFLDHAHEIISPCGRIICDSIDVSVTADPVHVACREQNIASGQTPGQQRFTMTYGDVTGYPFDWLHIDFPALSLHAGKAGWNAGLVDSEGNGHYLCQLKEVHI